MVSRETKQGDGGGGINPAAKIDGQLRVLQTPAAPSATAACDRSQDCGMELPAALTRTVGDFSPWYGRRDPKGGN